MWTILFCPDATEGGETGVKPNIIIIIIVIFDQSNNINNSNMMIAIFYAVFSAAMAVAIGQLRRFYWLKPFDPAQSYSLAAVRCVISALACKKILHSSLCILGYTSSLCKYNPILYAV
jgi:hypothetical protein